MMQAKDHTVVTGAVHIHTVDSDGTRTHEELAAMARETGLEFLLFSDHMTMQSYYEGKEGFYDGVLVLIGYEHNDQDDCNHYLIFGIDEVLPSGMSAKEYVAAAAARGGLGIMAHPDEFRGRDARFRSYPWTAWDAEGFDGVEIWNQMSQWMESLKFYNQLRMIFSPRKGLRSPTRWILRKWDEMNMSRRVVGIGSIDAHGFPYRVGPLRLTIFPYKVQFKSIRTHLILDRPLAGDLPEARRQVYDAIRSGRAFVSNYRWGQARDFHFEIGSPSGTAISGGEIAYEESTRLAVSLPLRGRICLIGNGKMVAEYDSREIEHPVPGPGIYRVEVYRGRRGWIFSNHIRVTGGGS